jgi:uncharacterized protein YfkK (UPF0435 family)
MSLLNELKSLVEGCCKSKDEDCKCKKCKVMSEESVDPSAYDELKDIADAVARLEKKTRDIVGRLQSTRSTYHMSQEPKELAPGFPGPKPKAPHQKVEEYANKLGVVAMALSKPENLNIQKGGTAEDKEDLFKQRGLM